MPKLQKPGRLLAVVGVMVAVSGRWIGYGLAGATGVGNVLQMAGLFLVGTALFWSYYRLRLPITHKALVDLICMHRFNPDCPDLAALLADPKRKITWREAYAAEKACQRGSDVTENTE